MAGRIPQSFLDTLLDRVDIVDVVDRRVKLKKTGKNYSALCPFHDEKTPSFSVNPDKQFYYCFGCGAGGNALGFVMDYENLEFPQAVDNLAATVGLEVPREESSERDQQRREQHQALYDLLDKAAQWYGQQLRRHPEARRAVDYLKQRGLSGEIAARFDLGFAPPGWDNLMKALAQDDAGRNALTEAGLLVQNDAGRRYDRFRDRVIFPIRDQRGRVIAFGGRVLGDDKPKYLNSPETPVFHKGRELYGLYQARKHNRSLQRILVVEGYMDVIALAQHDINYAVATLGTATSETHLQRIFRMVPEVVFCFDGDEAGRKAAQRAMEATLPNMEDGRQARFLFLPDGEDPDTLVRARGADHLLHLIDNAMPLEDFLFEVAGEGLNTLSLDGKARMSKLALPYLNRLPTGVYRELMFDALAQRTGLTRESLAALTPPEPPPEAIPEPLTEASFHSNSTPENAAPQSHEPPPPAEPVQRPAQPRPRGFSNLAQSAIALLLHQPSVAASVRKESLEGLSGADIALLRDLIGTLHSDPQMSYARLMGYRHGTPEGELMNRLASQERLIPGEGIEQQFCDTIESLSRQMSRMELEAEVDKLRGANYADMSELDKLRLKEKLSQLTQLRKHRGPG